MESWALVELEEQKADGTPDFLAIFYAEVIRLDHYLARQNTPPYKTIDWPRPQG